MAVYYACVVWLLNKALLYSPGFAVEQVGRSLLELLISSSFGIHLKLSVLRLVRERKVRTLQGSEPANGGALLESEIWAFGNEISSRRLGGDDKCNRKQTSLRALRSRNGISNRTSDWKVGIRKPGWWVKWCGPWGLKVRAHRRRWWHLRPGKLLAVQDQIGRRQKGCPPDAVWDFRSWIWDLKFEFSAMRSRMLLRPPGRSLDPIWQQLD